MPLAPIFPVIQPTLKTLFPQCLWEGCPQRGAIALTFDDGPHPTYTPPLLAVLERYQVPASFFWLGCNVDRVPTIARQAYEQGHWVGLHGYQHQSFPLLSSATLRTSLEQTQRAIAQACQLPMEHVQRTIRDVRPPNGLFTPLTLADLRTWGYRPVMWSVVPEDWVQPGVSVVLERVRQQVRSGSLVVLHDGYYGGQDVVAIAERLIPELLAAGYQFVTVDQLWQTALSPAMAAKG